MRTLIRLPALALVAAFAATSLSGCGGKLTYDGAAALAGQVEQASLPRKRVETLARVLKATQEGLGAAYNAKQLTAAQLLATEAPAGRAKAALQQAGDLLDTAANDRALADTAPDNLAKLQYTATAAANEALALQRSSAAETDINPLREQLNRARGVPVAVAVPK